MNLYYLGREGILDDTKPTKNEESIYKKLKNNEKEMTQGTDGNKQYYNKLNKLYKNKKKS